MSEPQDHERRELELQKLRLALQTDQVKLQQARLELDKAQRADDRERASDEEARTLVFVGSVNEDSVLQASERLRIMSRRFPRSPLTVVFNSPGGTVIHGLALYDQLLEMRDNGHHIVTVARGQVASMGGILLQAGSERVIGRHAHMLVHEVAYGAHGKLGEMEDRLAFSRQLSERLLTILADRSTLSKAEIRERWHKTDWWLNARQAVKLGFADRVG